MFTQKFARSDLLLQHPFTAIVAGPSSSGKSVLTREIINNFDKCTTIYKPRIKVLWCYSLIESVRPLTSTKVDVSFFEGVPTIKKIREESPDILVLDDLVLEVAKSDKIADIFIKGSHHLNLSVFFLTQNLFVQGKAMRNISLQAKYLIFMKSTRDSGQFKTIARQSAIGYDNLLKAYMLATERPFSYLLLDFSQNTPDDLRLRSKITPRKIDRFEIPVFAPIIYKNVQ
jgi:hypothetical protein